MTIEEAEERQNKVNTRTIKRGKRKEALPRAVSEPEKGSLHFVVSFRE
jgi:hypothetical protein